MLEIFSLILVVIILCSLYLNKFNKRTIGFLLIMSLISFPTIIIYLAKGNMESYSFEDKLNQIIGEGINDPQKFKDIDPKLLIIFLEKKLKKNPQDLEGWLILSRTCVMSGHYQKADKYYHTALQLFPTNENILLEISLLKKNTNQTKSAKNYLYKLKNLYPQNIIAREMLIEIFMNNSLRNEATEEFNQLRIIKKKDEEYIKSIRRKYNLD